MKAIKLMEEYKSKVNLASYGDAPLWHYDKLYNKVLLRTIDSQHTIEFSNWNPDSDVAPHFIRRLIDAIIVKGSSEGISLIFTI